MNKSESIKELAGALCKFQGTVEKVRKEATNPFFRSKYATLANILDVVRKPLSENGLSVIQLPKGSHELTTIIMHDSGEWIEETYEMTPTKNDPQGLGSAITYQRRYALGAALGLNIDDDDDGNRESKPAKDVKQLTADEVAKFIEAAQSIKDLSDIWKNNQHLHNDQKTLELLTAKKNELTVNVQ